jgi:hypothetical protein|tara:strand:- start:515 stop:1012 length:498 start_codon:yes stop_codon:yes gene_type:complete
MYNNSSRPGDNRLTENKLTEILEKEILMMSVLPKGTHETHYRNMFDLDYVWYRTVMGLSENISNSRKRAAKFGWKNNLTIPYLAQLWFEQKGRCALTGIMLEYESGDVQSKNPYRTSVDRIDNNLGYIQGNVRLLTHWANNAKSTWPDETFIKFVKFANTVAEHA